MSGFSMRTSPIKYSNLKIQINTHRALHFEWFRIGVSSYGKTGTVFFLKFGHRLITVTLYRMVKPGQA